MSKKYVASYFMEPAFFKDFACIGSECRSNCCSGWRIDWKESEVEKLNSADCSPKLRELVETSFIPNEALKNNFQIKLDENKSCPFQTEEKLCLIQKELGAEYLSFVCQSYPRITRECGSAVLRTCYISCPHVMNTLLNDPDCMKLERITPKGDHTTAMSSIISDLDILNHPELKYIGELFEFFYETLENKNYSIETGVTLAAMAAQQIDRFIAAKKYDRIPDIIKACQKQFADPVQIEKIENARPNLTFKANFMAGMLKYIGKGNILYTIFEGGVPNEEKYREGMEIFNKEYKDSPFMLRNIALNLYISMKMPFRNLELTCFENLSVFVSELAVIKLLMPNVALGFKPLSNFFEIAVAYMDRAFTHRSVNDKAVVEFLKLLKCTTPAYLLELLK